MRVSPDVDLPSLDKKIAEWAKEAGVTITFISGHDLSNPATSTDAKANPYWAAFSDVLTKLFVSELLVLMICR
jgi:hypothetical protein